MGLRRWLMGILVALTYPTAEDAEAMGAERHRPAEGTGMGFRVEVPTLYVWDESPTEIEGWRRDLGLVEDARRRVAPRALVHETAPPVVCGACRRLRDDRGEWQPPRTAVDPRRLSHGICPACARERFPGLVDDEA